MCAVPKQLCRHDFDRPKDRLQNIAFILSAISSGKLVALSQHSSRGCSRLSDTHFTAESTESLRIKCLAQGHNILIQPVFEPWVAVSRNRHITNMTIMLHKTISMNWLVVHTLNQHTPVYAVLSYISSL